MYVFYKKKKKKKTRNVECVDNFVPGFALYRYSIVRGKSVGTGPVKVLIENFKIITT